MPIGTEMKNVERAEEALGVRLPSALRGAYTLANRPLEIDLASDPEDDVWTTFPVFDPDFAAKTASHLVYENHGDRRWARFPKHTVAIAADGSGNRLAIVANGQRLVVDLVHAMEPDELGAPRGDDGEDDVVVRGLGVGRDRGQARDERERTASDEERDRGWQRQARRHVVEQQDRQDHPDDELEDLDRMHALCASRRGA